MDNNFDKDGILRDADGNIVSDANGNVIFKDDTRLGLLYDVVFPDNKTASAYRNEEGTLIIFDHKRRTSYTQQDKYPVSKFSTPAMWPDEKIFQFILDNIGTV